MGIIYDRAPMVTQAIAEAGIETARKGWSAIREKQAINEINSYKTQLYNQISSAVGSYDAFNVFNDRSNVVDYLLKIRGLKVDTDQTEINLRFSKDGISADNGAGKYGWSAVFTDISGQAIEGNSSDTSIRLCSNNTSNQLGNLSNERFNCNIIFHHYGAGYYRHILFESFYTDAGGEICQFNGAGIYKDTTQYTGFQIFPDSGNITNAEISLQNILIQKV